MGSTYTHLLFPVVFSTKDRCPTLRDEFEERLHAYMGGILRRLGGSLRAAGGMPHPIHLLMSLPADRSIAEAVRFLKANSSKWVHETLRGSGAFAWQRGYGAFTVSESQADKVIRYIRDQREHHRKKPFKEEFLAFLKAHGIRYDERYIWT